LRWLPQVDRWSETVSELFKRGKFLAGMNRGRIDTKGEALRRVAIVEGSVGGPERLLSLAALFPETHFDSIGSLDGLQSPCDVVIVALARRDAESLFARVVDSVRPAQVVVVLQDADLNSTRRLIRLGAADVLPAPVSEMSLTLSLERLFEARPSLQGEGDSSQIVSFLKAGGGAGTTSLIAQLAPACATAGMKTAAVDLDLQFGNLGFYLDLSDAVSISDLLASGIPLDETPFSTALRKHRSGAQLLAGPRDLMPLETISPPQVDALMRGLRQSFDITLVDLPGAWTAWTNEILHLSDRIFLVTQLSVPHVNLMKRQLQVLASQGLEATPTILVCNALSSEQQESVSLKAAERSLGRVFDVVLPCDVRSMNAAINQGVELSSVRRGTKLEKALAQLLAVVRAPVSAERQAKG
jgi:pilus assembly protein CpaE